MKRIKNHRCDKSRQAGTNRVAQTFEPDADKPVLHKGNHKTQRRQREKFNDKGKLRVFCVLSYDFASLLAEMRSEYREKSRKKAQENDYQGSNVINIDYFRLNLPERSNYKAGRGQNQQ